MGLKRFFKKITRGVKKIFKPVVNFVTGAVNSVVNFVSNMVGGKFSTPDLGSVSQAQANNEGVLLNRSGTLNNIPVVYGQRKVGGTIVFMDTNGNRNQHLYMAIVLSEGRVESIGKVFIDGIDADDSRFTQRNLIDIEKNTGSDTQQASALLKQCDSWTDDHRLQGVAYLACKFTMPEVKTQEDADKNPWSGIPKIQAIVKGKMVASSATAGASDYATENAPLSNPTSNNPADIILDYLRNPRFGRGLSNDQIDFPSFSAARALYATQVTLADGTQTAFMQLNPVLDTGATVMDNLKKLLVQAQSGLPYVQGKFKLKPQFTGSLTSPVDPTPTPVFDLEEKHIVDGVELVDPGIRNQANQVRVSYIDPNQQGGEQDWSTNEVIYPTVDSARDLEMLTEDNDKRVIKEYNLEYITHPGLAGYHAKLLCENERRLKTMSVKCTAELHDVEVGDIIRVKWDSLGLNYAFFKVISWEVDDNYEITLGLKEHLPANYSFDNNWFVVTPKQRNYVGDTQRVTVYIFNPATGDYEPIKGGPVTGLPFLPRPPFVPFTALFKFAINSTTSIARFDNPTNPLETVRLVADISDMYFNTYSEVEVVQADAVTGALLQIAKVTPALSTGTGSTSDSKLYNIDFNVPLDGIKKAYYLRVLTASKSTALISSVFEYTSLYKSVYKTIIKANI